MFKSNSSPTLTLLGWVRVFQLFANRHEPLCYKRTNGKWIINYILLYLPDRSPFATIWKQHENWQFVFFPLQTLTHPVLYRLMSNKWFGEFRTLARSPLLSLQYLKWFLLNIWCVFDVLFFPVLLVLFYIIHICRDKARKKKGNLLQRIIFIRRLRICSVRTIISKFSTHPFEMIA